MASLADLDPGQHGRVAGIDLPASDKQRLLELGLTLGSVVSVVRVAPFGDPIELKVRGYFLSLRRNDARNVAVEPLADS